MTGTSRVSAIFLALLLTAAGAVPAQQDPGAPAGQGATAERLEKLATLGAILRSMDAVRDEIAAQESKLEQADEGAGPVALWSGLRLGLALTAAGILVIGIYPQPFLDFATQSIRMLGMAF